MNRLYQTAKILRPSSSAVKMPASDLSLWKMNHTMVRVKDPVRSIGFYQKLGMTQIDKLVMADFGFDLYFLACDSDAPSAGKLRSDRQGLLELTHNYGTETNDTYTVANGNDEPHLGFEKLGLTVKDLSHILEHLGDIPVKVSQKSADGKPFVAVVQDPDGYYVELTQGASTTLNSTGLRIKDPKVSLPWYEESLGMKVLKTLEESDRTTYKVGYIDGAPERAVFEREGLLNLIWIHGSELKEGNAYHNGNAEPQGFGHLALSTDDITAACEYLESKNVEFKKRLVDGKLKSIAFILDPDGYWFEVIQNARIKEPLGIQ